MEFTKDSNGKVTGEIKIDEYESLEIYRAIRCYEEVVKDSNRSCEHFLKGYPTDPTIKFEEEDIARLKRQFELLQYELCPIRILRENMEKLGQIGAEE